MGTREQDPIQRRLREAESQLDSATAETARLRQRYAEAMRPGKPDRWPISSEPLLDRHSDA